MENLRLNDLKNVEVRKVGVGARHEMRRMGREPLMPGGASVEEKTVAGLLRADTELNRQRKYRLLRLTMRFERRNSPRRISLRLI